MAYLWLSLLIKRKYYNIKHITYISFKDRINGNFHLLFIYALNFSNRNNDKSMKLKKRLVLSFLGDLCALWCPWNPGIRNNYTVSLFQSEKSKASQAPPWRRLIKVDFVLCSRLCSNCWFLYSCVTDKIYKELGKWKYENMARIIPVFPWVRQGQLVLVHPVWLWE